MSARDLAATVRAIKDAIWEQGCEGFEGLPNARADSIIAWFADREAALEKQAADAQAEIAEWQESSRVRYERAEVERAARVRAEEALRLIAELDDFGGYSGNLNRAIRTAREALAASEADTEPAA